MASDISQDHLPSLFKDGISEDLYKLMWSKDELNFGPSINIPDTIVYKYGQPTSWYFTALNGRVKKKNKHNLISAKIEEVFNKHVLGYDVLAYFINVPVENDANQANAPITIEYLDRTALNDFLYNRKKEVNGFLQRFIEPKTTHNEVIRAVWSPKVCLLERAENIHQLHDHRYGLYERCVIYEGPEYYFTSAPLRGPVLSGQIQKLSEQIVSHISEVTFGQKQVSRIVLNFKVDSRDKIWLLYSTSIRCVDMLEYSSAASTKANRLERTLVNIDSVVSLSSTVSLNPMKSYEKILPKVRVRCLSCAAETLEDSRHPVNYKCIIKHYEHVLHLLASDSSSIASSGSQSVPRTADTSTSQTSGGGGGVMVSWPPDKEILETAGGVGFGCLFINDLGEVISANKLEHAVRYKNIRDLQVPPIIHALHNKLNAKSYQRCRFDPLFLYKTVHVCEPCYLVYAEFASMLLRMGQDLTKLLTPDPIAHTHSSALLERSTLTRPSSAEWRAISTAGGSYNKSMSAGSMIRDGSAAGSFRPSANHRHAKSSAIGLRSSEVARQPDVPSTIRSASEQDLVKTYSYYSSGGGSPSRGVGGNLEFGNSTISTYHQQPTPQQQQVGLSHSQSTASYVPSAGSGGNPEDVKAMIAERERHFFKEISLNPQLRDQHPLMHLISAQQKLKLVDQQSGVLTSKSAAQTESIFGTKYGRQTGDTFDKFSAYTAELPYAINGEIILPSKLRARKADQLAQLKVTRQKSLMTLLGRSDATGAEDNDEHNEQQLASSIQKVTAAKSVNGGTITSGTAATSTSHATKASQKHRDFLNEALRAVESEVDLAHPFVGKNTATAEDNAVQSRNGDQKHRSPGSRRQSKLKGTPSKKGNASQAPSVAPDSRRSSSSSVQPPVIRSVDAPSPVSPLMAPSSPSPAQQKKSKAEAASPKQHGTKQSSSSSPTKKSGGSTKAQQPTVAGKADGGRLRQASDRKLSTGMDSASSQVTDVSGSQLDGGSSLVDNASIGDQSTESQLMLRWGLQPSAAIVDPAMRQEEMRRIMEASNELYSATGGDLSSQRRLLGEGGGVPGSMHSLSDGVSLGEQSTESVLMRRWGIAGDAAGAEGSPMEGGDGDADSVYRREEERAMLLGEASSLMDMMGPTPEPSVTVPPSQASEDAKADGSDAQQVVIESVSQDLVRLALSDATRNIASR